MLNLPLCVDGNILTKRDEWIFAFEKLLLFEAIHLLSLITLFLTHTNLGIFSSLKSFLDARVYFYGNKLLVFFIFKKNLDPNQILTSFRPYLVMLQNAQRQKSFLSFVPTSDFADLVLNILFRPRIGRVPIKQ